VWAVDGVAEDDLIESPEHHFYVPKTIPTNQLELVRRDIPPRDDRP